ncbi:MAG: hypothetical protein WAX43_01300 [Lactococcus chungangensis]
MTKFSYRVVIASYLAATSLVAMPSAKKFSLKVIKALYAANNRSRKSSF